MKGVMGKILFVDLTSGEMHTEYPPESVYQEYLGGYGLGVKILYDRMKPGVDPLGPDNIFGLLTGPLTGTRSITGNRWIAVGKSPKTGGWGDANCGGTFGPALKSAGYDAIFFTGASDHPVYLYVTDEQVELRDASHLWGMDGLEAEAKLKEELGKKFEIALIGLGGEKLNLTAGVMNDFGRAAARSGLGAVMGSKKLKAVAASGSQKISVANDEALGKYVQETMRAAKNSGAPIYEMFTTFGTSGATAASAFNGDSPVKNWAGVGEIDFPNAHQISDVVLQQYEKKRDGCWHCMISCSGHLVVPDGPYKADTHRPEYETLGAFGTMTLIDNTAAMVLVEELCGRYGLDSIAAGSVISFAMECYEKGLITQEDTGGLELTWGNTDAMIELLHQIGKREGFGAVLADGVKVAAQRIGKGSEKFAIHVNGEEIAMHDPRNAPGLALTYQVDATPGRHTQGGTGGLEMLGMPIPEQLGGAGKHEYSKKGMAHRILVNSNHLLNAAGLCYFSALVAAPDAPERELEFVTGETFDMQRAQAIGERIAVLRHAFNLREGINPVELEVPHRLLSGSMLAGGPNKDVEVDNNAQRMAYFATMGWDQETAQPPKEQLKALNLDFVIPDLYASA